MLPNRNVYFSLLRILFEFIALGSVQLLILARQISHRYDKYLTEANLHNRWLLVSLL